jgi:hypothetical protein
MNLGWSLWILLGFIKKDRERLEWKLKEVYGLKQASWLWNIRFNLGIQLNGSD